MKQKKIYNRPFLWTVVVISFLLAIMDMFFLQNVFEKYFEFELFGASFSALALATAANISALLWGKQKGERESGKGFLGGWVFLGLAYFMLRTIPFVNEIVLPGKWEFSPIMKQLGPVLILAISYIGTGTAIEWAANQLWDLDVVKYLKTKKEFEAQEELIANNRSALLKMIKDLEEYDNNYTILDKQYDACAKKIFKYEQATLNMIAGKTKELNPSIDPEAVNTIMEAVLAKRANKNEKSHNR